MGRVKKLKVALVCGGKSSEREISLKSGEEVAKALNPDRYEVFRYDPREDLPLLISEAPHIDVALILLHGRLGEDGTIQGLLDLIGLPYQGSGVLASAMAMNKKMSKIIFRYHGLPVPRDLVLRKDEMPTGKDIEQALGFPVMVKPCAQGSSIGMSLAQSAQELSFALEKAFTYDPEVIIEEFIAGREITVSVLGNRNPEALPLVEITPGEGHTFFNYRAKYQMGASREICPAPIDPELARLGGEYGITAHQVLQCRGYSRTDMILRGRDWYILETNTIPGMTATSLLPLAAKAAGLSFSDLLDRLIQLALEPV
jgi:D-alanine-D-alanine ligase